MKDNFHFISDAQISDSSDVQCAETEIAISINIFLD